MSALGKVVSILPGRLQLRLRYLHERRRGVLPNEMRLLFSRVRRHDLAVDVGASYGVYAYALSKRFRGVEAFEPNPEIAAQLRRSAPSNVRLHNVALSSNEGSAELHVPIEKGRPNSWLGTLGPVNGSSQAYSVLLKTLDGFDFRGLGALKIDVEGHELEVLKGAQATLTRERPVVLMEVERRHIDHPMSQVFDFLTKRGFTGHYIAQDGLHPLEEFSYERHQKPFLDRVLSPDYINGFLFVPVD